MFAFQRLLVLGGICSSLSISCASAPGKTPQSTPTISTSNGDKLSDSAPEAACSESLTKEVTDLSNQGDRNLAIDPDGALVFYEKAAVLAPHEARIHFKIGNVHKKKDDWDKAAEAFGRATSLAPTFANYWFWYGYSLEMKAKRDKSGLAGARDAYEKCIAADENYAECYQRLGSVCLFMDDEHKALEYYTKSIRVDPKNIPPYAELADLYLNLGFVDEAEVVLNEAKKFAKPGDKPLFWVHVLMSEVKNERGDVVARVAELEAAKAVAGTEGAESFQILFMLGSTYATINPPRTAEAIALLKGFLVRACVGPKAAAYTVECSQTRAMLNKLGAKLP